MSNKFAIVVLAIVLMFSIAFSCLLIASLKDSSQGSDDGVVDTTAANTTDNTTPENEENTTAGDETTAENSGNKPNNNEGLQKAPDITVYDVTGAPVQLSTFFGKPIVLNFWASWCGPCKEEMPAFQEVYNEYKDNVVFLIVNSTYSNAGESPEAAINYIIAEKYTFPIYLDTTGARSNYGVAAIPFTFFINEDGYIVSSKNTSLSKDRLISEIGKIYTP